MQYMIGSGENMYDFTYVGNVVQAHLLAAEKLTLASPIAGQAYFITNQARPSLCHITHSLLNACLGAQEVLAFHRRSAGRTWL